MKKVLLIRLDKIGDLVSSLPIDQLPEFKDCDIHWVIAEGLFPLVKQAEPARQYTEISLQDSPTARKKLKSLLAQFQPEIAVVFYGPWWVGYELFQAKVPLRVGRASQWHSFIFFNRRLRQSRSKSEKHEADYNRDLVDFALITPELSAKDISFGQKPKTPVLRLTATPNRHLLEKYDLKSGQFFVVHPGMAGSALNWPTEKYIELIEKLIPVHTVVITGTSGDEKYLAAIKEKYQTHPQVRILQSRLNMTELLSLLSMSRAVVAPSTGVLHMASSLGVKAIGIYSPILAHHPRRWGPRGSGLAVLPPADCPATLECLGSQCPHFNCMEKISSQEIYEKLMAEKKI